jgi:hypothetical protein
LRASENAQAAAHVFEGADERENALRDEFAGEAFFCVLLINLRYVLYA